MDIVKNLKVWGMKVTILTVDGRRFKERSANFSRRGFWGVMTRKKGGSMPSGFYGAWLLGSELDYPWIGDYSR